MITAKRRIIIALLVFIATLGYELSYSVHPAYAIPAFARKYNFVCSMCHVPSFPKLNDFGNQFRDRGYQLNTEEELPTWEGLTRGYWPIAFRPPQGISFSRHFLADLTSPSKATKV